jgi:hypothetical protein
MPDDAYRTIRALLASKKPEDIQKGLRLIAIEITKIGSVEARPLFEMVTTLSISTRWITGTRPCCR